MNTGQQSLRLGIDGSWTATEMSDSFAEINYLYNLRLFLNSIEDAEPYWDELYHFFPPFRRKAKQFGIPNPFFFPHGTLVQRPDEIQQFSRIYFPEHVLQVSRIEYGSPGGKDFLGIGEILKQIREFIQFLIERRQAFQEKQLSNDAQRIQNARDFVRLRLEFTRANAEIQEIENNGLAELVDDNTRAVQKLIDSDKITSVTMLEDDSDTSEQQAL